MSIDRVEVINPQGDLLTFTLDDISSGYTVEDITGLDPVKATIVSSGFAGLDGEQYQASSRGSRNVVISLGYSQNFSTGQTIRDLRSRLYQFFMPTYEVKLIFYMSDGLVVTTIGRVESCEAPPFTREPQMTVSIICHDPDFIDTDPVVIDDVFTTTDTTPSVIEVAGSVQTGLTSLSFTAALDFNEFSIYHTTPSGEVKTMLISAPFLLGDVINLCTVRGKKNLTLTRGGVTTSILWAVSPEANWVLLERGENQFYLNASTTDPSPVTISYNNRYGGL